MSEPTSAGEGFARLPTAVSAPPDDLAGKALALYSSLADARRRMEETEAACAERLRQQQLDSDAVIAAIASTRFEFERLLRRIVPLLEACRDCNSGEAVQAIKILQRAWDADLERQHVRVRDLAGAAVDEELAELIKVESNVKVRGVHQTRVRETIQPLVTLRGRPLARAVVITEGLADGQEEGV